MIKRPALGFLGIWFFLTLVPTSTILPLEDPIFEHRIYLSLSAFITLIVVAVYSLLQRVLPGKKRIVIGFLILAAAATMIGYMSYRRNRIYQNPLSLWQSIVDQQPEHARGHYNLGLELSKAGRREAAIVEYREAEICFQEVIRIQPAFAPAHYRTAESLMIMNQPDQALLYYLDFGAWIL